MEEAGVLENPDSITRLLPAFEPGHLLALLAIAAGVFLFLQR